MASLGTLTLWKIPEDHLSASDHKLILLKWENLRQGENESKPALNIRWNIQP